MAQGLEALAESALSILVRHASAGSRHHWAGDDSLRPLDDRGRRQAEEIAAALSPLDVRRVVSSPYVRCVQTVEPLAAELGLEVELDERLAEGEGSAAAPLLEEHGVVACTHGDIAVALLGHGLKKAEFVSL